jgi:hypothetical protein
MRPPAPYFVAVQAKAVESSCINNFEAKAAVVSLVLSIADPHTSLLIRGVFHFVLN